MPAEADKPIVVHANRIKFHGKGSGNVGQESWGGEPALASRPPHGNRRRDEIPARPRRLESEGLKGARLVVGLQQPATLGKAAKPLAAMAGSP